ncbi:MAG: hypothetical protein ACYCSS_10925, partial [Sulfuriferula sp.]
PKGTHGMQLLVLDVPIERCYTFLRYGYCNGTDGFIIQGDATLFCRKLIAPLYARVRKSGKDCSWEALI